ncbi:MAG: DUF885 domain-containing protein [Candidatus Eisenbacteria bacterium]
MGVEREVKALADEYFDFFVESFPELATFVGVHAYDDRLSGYDRQSLDTRVRKFREYRTRALELAKREELPVSARVDATLVANSCEMGLVDLEKLVRPWTNPILYIEMSLMGLFLLATREVLPLEKRAASIAARLREFRRVLAEAKQNLENPPHVFTKVAIAMLKGAGQFVGDTVSYLGEKVPASRTSLEESAAVCMEAIREFGEYAESELLPRSSGDFAIGRETFDLRLRVDHMLDIDTRALAKRGRELLASTKDEIERLARELDPGRSWREIIDRLKDNHPRAGELRSVYEQHMRKARDFVVATGLVPVPPGEELRVIDTPGFERATIPYAAYMSPGALDERQEGLFFVTPVDPGAPLEVQQEQLRGHSRASIVLTALHEGYPGHHLQLVHSNRVQSRVRHICMNTVFAEGWALYCEHLMKEKGFYESKEVELFQLKDMLWRASRVVVDVGLHTGSMAFEEAVEFLVAEALIERPNAVAEVTRYTSSPTQPSSYAIGKAEVLALRDAEERRQGSRFSLSDFHEKLLSSGTIPFALVKPELAEKA